MLFRKPSKCKPVVKLGGRSFYSCNGFRDIRGNLKSGELGISDTLDFGAPYIGLCGGLRYGRFSLPQPLRPLSHRRRALVSGLSPMLRRCS